jgi:hypothetical protein
MGYCPLPPPPTPFPTPFPTPGGTPQVTPEATPTPTPTPTPQVTPGPTPTPTPRPTPGATPTQTPQATPTPTATVPPQPLQISCSISKDRVAVGETTTFSAVQVPDSIPISWAFDHGDGTIDPRNPSEAFYTAPGTYTVTVIADLGPVQRTEPCGTVTVLPGEWGARCSISDTLLQVGETTTLSASSTPEGLDVSYTFFHGDGFSETANPSFATYAGPGSYTVTLEATYLGSTIEIVCGTVTVDSPVQQICTSDGYNGLTEAAAGALATSRGCAWRVVVRDGNPLQVTTDFRQDRVNFDVDNGIVTRTTVG